MKKQQLLALVDTGCSVNLVSEAAARRCNLPVHSLAQSIRLQFTDGNQNIRIGKNPNVVWGIGFTMRPIKVVRCFYVGPVHHVMIRGMPWMTQWKERMRPQQEAIDVCAPGANEGVQLLVLATDLT